MCVSGPGSSPWVMFNTRIPSYGSALLLGNKYPLGHLVDSGKYLVNTKKRAGNCRVSLQGTKGCTGRMWSLSVSGTVSTMVKQQPWLEAIWGRWASQALFYAFKHCRIPEGPGPGLCEKQATSQLDFTTKMLTHSVAVAVWDVCPKAWLWFCQWRLSALQISHGGPMGVSEREKREGGREKEMVGWRKRGEKGETVWEAGIRTALYHIHFTTSSAISVT